MRSYVAARSINPLFEGHSIYRENDDFKVIKEHNEYNYLYVLCVSVLCLVASVQLGAIAFVWKQYDALQKKVELGTRYKGQHFRFKSIFWATIFMLAACSFIVLGLDFHNFIKSAVTYKHANIILGVSVSNFIVLILLIIINAGFSLIMTIKTYHFSNMIELPKLLSCFENKKCPLSFLVQFLVINTLALSPSLLSFHICGIAIASLVNPLEVLNKIIFLFAIIVPTFFFIVHTIEGLETGKISFPNLPYVVILFVLFIIFSMLFFFSYVNVVLFAAVDNYVVVSALSQAIPVVLVGITIGLTKAEYKNYKDAQNNNEDAQKLLCSNGTGNDQPV